MSSKTPHQVWKWWSLSIKKARKGKALERKSQRRNRVSKLEQDPESWFTYYFPDFCTAPPAAFHKLATIRVFRNPEWFEVRAWSRELAKSSRTMMEVFYLVLVGYPEPAPAGRKKAARRKPAAKPPKQRKRNVLLISNSLENAARLLDPYRTNFEQNERIREDYGPQKKPGSWTAEEFITRHGAAFRALGAGQSPRGTRNQSYRPDVILFDDVDTDSDCRNPALIQKRWKWIQEAVIPVRSLSSPLLIVFCGNLIAQDCCVIRATEFADHTDIINIRDEHGRSSWPEKNSEADIDRTLRLISLASAQKEYFNNPITEGCVFQGIRYGKCLPLRAYELLVCYTDPSYKGSKQNDYKATVLCGKTGDEFHILKAFVFQGTVARMIDAHYEIMDLVGDHNCYYYLEQVFLQEMFLQEFYAAGKARGRMIPITGDTRTKGDKFVRIEALLEPLNRNGKLIFNEAEKDDAGMKMLEQQFLAFSPGSHAHDDGPDAVEGAVWILNQKTARTSSAQNISLIARKRSDNAHF
jgi:predicted phage terminase large subunit-like protein